MKDIKTSFLVKIFIGSLLFVLEQLQPDIVDLLAYLFQFGGPLLGALLPRFKTNNRDVEDHSKTKDDPANRKWLI